MKGKAMAGAFTEEEKQEILREIHERWDEEEELERLYCERALRESLRTDE